MTTTTGDYRTGVRALTLVEAIAERVATPAHAARWIRPGYRHACEPHSLGRGAAGIALLQIERVRAGLTDWSTVHQWLAHLTEGGIATSPIDGLYHGAPAVAYALHTAATVHTGSYRRALSALDTRITTDLRNRIEQTQARINRGELPRLAEWDLISGLTGVTRYLLARDPAHPAVREALTCLVRIATERIAHNGELVPGWWTLLDPTGRPNPDFDGGHGNLGLAHGITGLLALLAIATRHGVTVPNQTEALERICPWLDEVVQAGPGKPWWPQWIRHTEHGGHRIDDSKPTRPSWCYGVAGHAAAQHLAGHALADYTRVQRSHDALLAALAGDRLAALPEPNVCHGLAGLLHTLRHIANEDQACALATHLPHLLARLLDSLPAQPDDAAAALLKTGGPELLEGAIGVALTLLSAVTDPNLESQWDICLLLR